MNPHAAPSLSPLSLIRSLWQHRGLIVQLSRRDVSGRYKGSVIGIFWSLINPLLLLLLYTFVFSKVFEARWGSQATTGTPGFALMLFAGMIVHGLFSETLSRAPGLVLANVAYVKKIVFPLEVLPVVAIATAIFHAAVSVIVLLAALAMVDGAVPWTALLLPFVLLPLVLLSLGLSWILASLGVFLRDVGQPIGLAMTMLLFASPVFYPLSALPAAWRPWLMINPLTLIIEQTRAVLIEGRAPDFVALAGYCALALLAAWAGYAWFQKTRKGFANVV